MIHFLFGLYYVSLTVLLLLGYCLVVPVAFWLARWVVRILLHCVFTYSWRGWLKTVGLPINRACLRFVGVMLSALCVYAFSLYGKELIKWTGEGTAHHTAKVYFAAGQPLHGARLVLYRFFHPERRRLAPLWRLQERIYERAVQYLPEGDAEWAAWQNSWFLYPYTRTGRWVRGTRMTKPSPAQVAMLDKVWRCLETLATRPMADRKVALNLYMKTYPVLANYYINFDGFYTGQLWASFRKMVKIELHQERCRLLVTWLERLKREWAAHPEMTAFLREHPAPSALRDYVVIAETMQLILGEIYRREFSCEAESVRLYIDTRRHFITSGECRRNTHKENSDALYKLVVSDRQGNATRYILEEYCGVVFPGPITGAWWMSDKAKADKTAREYYAEEIKILNEARERAQPAPAE